MPKLEFSMNVSSPPEKLIAIATDYENFSKFVKAQIPSIKVLNRNGAETLTEETITLGIINHTILQKSLHKKIEPNKLETKIVSGPFKGTIAEVLFEKIDSGTKVTTIANLKIGLQYKIVSPLVKRLYKNILIGILYKMNNQALEYP